MGKIRIRFLKDMAEELKISAGTKEDKYRLLLDQIAAVVSSEDDIIANMANMVAMIHETFGFWWTGFYRVCENNPKQLVLGPFQGPLACCRIPFGRGVCGTAWAQAATVIVPEVDKFPGHIACSSASRSEIVVPVLDRSSGMVTAVLDIDSAELETFDDTDRIWLEKAVSLLG